MPMKKRTFTSLFKHREITRAQWPWPSCNYPRTNSFREPDHLDADASSVRLEVAGADAAATPDSWFTNSSESASFSTASEESASGGGDSTETIIRGLRSERFFFEPGDTKSILEEATRGAGGVPFKESVALAVESEDPYVDFLASMEEMVEAYGLKDWECLEQLLLWYLRMNGEKTHGFIVVAFVDLLIGILSAPASSSSSSSSFSFFFEDECKEVDESNLQN